MRAGAYRELVVLGAGVALTLAVQFGSAALRGSPAPHIAVPSVVSGAPASDAGAAPAVSPQPTAPVTTPVEVHIPILVYHNIRDKYAAKPAAKRIYEVTVSEFEEQMAYLESEGYHPVSFAALGEALAGATPLPEKPVLITLDDGRDDDYVNAYPILLKHHLAATLFPFTNAIGRPNYVTWEQIAEMREHGMDVQSHTVYHPYLTKADDATLATEMQKSKEVLENHFELSAVHVVAYPFGLHDARVDAAVTTAGYTMARSLRQSNVARSDGLLDLPGHIVTGNIHSFIGILSYGK